MSRKPGVQSSRNFLYVFCVLIIVGVPRSSSDDSVICYVLPVLWICHFSHERPGKGDASIGRILSDSPGAAPGTKSDG